MLQFLPRLFLQLSLLVLTSVGWGYWIWLICRVYAKPGRFGWLWCGFTGFTANAIFLQAFVYADLPLSYSAWYGLIVAAGGIGALVWRWRRMEWRPTCRTRGELWGLAVLGIAILVLQGWALWRIGPADYYERGKYDLVTYVQTAQFLADEPYSLEPEQIGLRPWLMMGLSMKKSRLTQSIVHGYLAVVSKTDGQNAYGALSIFYTLLPAFGAFALLRVLSLNRWAAGMAALWVGWLPAIASMHLEDFLSQISVLFIFPAMVGPWLETSGSSRLPVVASMTLTAFLYGAYTEYFLLSWGFLFFVMLFASRMGLWQKAIWYAAIITGSLLINPYYSYLSFEYLRVEVGSMADPAFLAGLAVESGTWRGLLRNFIDFDWLSERGSAVAGGIMALFYFCGLISGARRRRFILGISLAPFGAAMVMLAARELSKYPFAKMLASFAPIAVIIFSLGIYCACARFFGRRFRRARFTGAAFLGMLAAISAVGTWRLEQAVVAGGYFLEQINTVSMRAARRFMAKNPNLTYVVESSNPLVTAWLCYDARASDVYVRDGAIGDIGLYSEMFWCRRVPAGLRSFVQVDDRGVISVGELSPSPSVAVVNSQQVFGHGTNYIYRSDRPMGIDIDRHDQTPGLTRMILEFTVHCDSSPNEGSTFLHWTIGHQTGEIALTGQNVIILPLNLSPGHNRCELAVNSAKNNHPVSYFIGQIDLSPQKPANLFSR